MKKKGSDLKVREVLSATYASGRDEVLRPAGDLTANPHPGRVCYTAGRSLREQHPETPRLVAQVPIGRIRMDLSGLGIKLSPLAFALSVPDESLLAIHIREGDIAIVESTARTLRRGDLLVVTVNGRETIRRVTKVNGLWYLQVPGRKNLELTPLWEHPYQGIVVGCLRLFERARPQQLSRTTSRKLRNL